MLNLKGLYDYSIRNATIWHFTHDEINYTNDQTCRSVVKIGDNITVSNQLGASGDFCHVKKTLVSD